MAIIEYIFPHLNFDITINPSPDGIHHSYSGYFWNPESFSGMDVDPQPGDIVIAFIMCRTDALGDYKPYFSVTDDDGHQRTDWTKDMEFLVDDDATSFPDVLHPQAAHWGMAVWHKVWTSDDDPSTYDAYFSGYNNLNEDETGFATEVQMAMACVHSGDGAVTFEGINNTDSGFNQAALTTFERNYGDGASSWGWVEPSLAEQTDEFGTWGYYPGAGWCYYSCTGVNVYLFGAYGKWAFFVNAADDVGVEGWFFHPEDSIDFDDDAFTVSLPSGARDPQSSFSLAMLDVKQTASIRIAHNVRRGRIFTVSTS